MDNKKLIYYGAAHSLGVLAYVSLLVLFLNNAQKLFGKNDNVMTDVIMLLIFILSALITGSLVLGRPIMFYLDGKKTEAVKLLFYTTASLFVLLLLATGGLILLR
ncbi:hypothetical protein GW814_03075 [Candidatus Falkowbacteria bacterium]|nr:hypothetical protein [Candidatus Falkowbacteria bacterium]OIP80678.1 MAG: hypothetical protein AUK20_01130 [Parcubacteria group bacterium CG2_30_45_37]